MSDQDVKIVDSANNKVVKILEHNKKLSEMIVFNKYIITGDDKGSVRIWDCSPSDSQ